MYRWKKKIDLPDPLQGQTRGQCLYSPSMYRRALVDWFTTRKNGVMVMIFVSFNLDI